MDGFGFCSSWDAKNCIFAQFLIFVIFTCKMHYVLFSGRVPVPVAANATMTASGGESSAMTSREGCTVVGFYLGDEKIPYRTTIASTNVTLLQFKQLISKRGNYRLALLITVTELLFSTFDEKMECVLLCASFEFESMSRDARLWQRRDLTHIRASNVASYCERILLSG
jgi:hypothetical protein